MTRNLGIILARAGSVRLPGKNTREFAGKPMISWTYERALALISLGHLDHVVVSSDDPEVRGLAPEGIEVVERPMHLATSTATSFDAAVHALADAEMRFGRIDIVSLLQPTSPLASIASIASVVTSVSRGFAGSAITACAIGECDPSTGWAPTLKSNGMRGVDGTSAGCNSSNVSSGRFNIVSMERANDHDNPTHVITGAAYSVERDSFLKHRAFILRDCAGTIVPASEAIDIDTAQDWDAAVKMALAATIDQRVLIG
ncbi:acylneuraminate cytidylyltransferase family protein [Mesorhizobium sp. M2A.F.Ca.ET.039.01.1.1]|uniref:acylneuraminate cytidylyltransferase family protein n=1 Tax=Mesorhizobium sp. M2A.F.Ca.ET.039.01.1.1 TaxID=2496746 RepID=UPI000FC9C4AF|nr:acylneuraminate cytidylyltransferase family protein [Mesorhizobium sp. M2A.F.Ca.ET.039.01.1.1]RWX62867.1 acylneuraminate cytidylyltransferase family protein [Mesorhizobium sp. M2A.F.Ca.ET.039.01.1.1]